MGSLLHNEVNLSCQSAPAHAGPRSDAELVQAVRLGDKRAFVEIVARHQSMVCGIALGILGDFAAGEDAAQEAFVAAWQSIRELREPERLKGWLCQIARNAALGHRRRKKGEASLDERLDLPDEAPQPDEILAKSEETALVCDALAKLPETYRLPLVLYYREGQSVHAVAETLALSEEAVRQRLARGREMLRDRMTKLVESVLIRTGPTAVFTVAVAAAIGALATPSAIAGGVFATTASASSGAAPSATTTTSSILGMIGMKTTITAVFVLVASLPLGYGIKLSKRSGQPTRSTSAQAALPTSTNAPLQFQNSAWYAHWRRLHETYGTDSAAMPLIYKAINDIKDSFQRRAFNAALISEWVQVDPAGAFAFFSADEHTGGQRRQMFGEWLARDPKAAIDAFLANSKPWNSTVHDALLEVAKYAPTRLAEVVALLPKPDNFWDANVRDAFSTFAEGSLAQARNAAENLTGPNRQQALEGVARAWSKADPAAAITWARSLPNGTDRNEVIRAALVGLAGVSPAAALDQIGIVPPGGKQMYFATTTGARVLSAAVQTDFDGTVAWVAAHPGRLTQEDLAGMAQAVTQRLNADPAGFLSSRAADGSLGAILPAIASALLNGSAGQQGAVWSWLATQPDSDSIRSLKDQVLNAAAWQDPAVALTLSKDLPATAEGDKELTTFAQSLLNGGSMLYRFDSLYAQASDRLREPLLEAAFRCLRGDNLDNPQTWLSRLAQLPQSSEDSAQQSLARAWAERSPEAAIAWAHSLGLDSGRATAESAIVSAWATTDPVSAGSWVSSLGQGPEKDQSAKALAYALSETRPSDAWNWALNISDQSMRMDAATHIAKLMAGRDLNATRQWIESSSLPAAAKAQLQASLDSGSNAIGP